MNEETIWLIAYLSVHKEPHRRDEDRGTKCAQKCLYIDDAQGGSIVRILSQTLRIIRWNVERGRGSSRRWKSVFRAGL